MAGFASLPAGGTMDSPQRVGMLRNRLRSAVGGAPPPVAAGKLPGTGAGGGWMTPGGPGKPPTPDPVPGPTPPPGTAPASPFALDPYPDQPRVDPGTDFAQGPDAYVKSAGAGGGGMAGLYAQLLAQLGGGNAERPPYNPVTGAGGAGPSVMWGGPTPVIPTEQPYSPEAGGPLTGVGLDTPGAGFNQDAYLRSFLPPAGGDSMAGGLGGLSNIIPDESGQAPAPTPRPKPNTQFPTRGGRPGGGQNPKPRQPAGGVDLKKGRRGGPPRQMAPDRLGAK